MLRRSQSSLIELLIITVCVSACLIILISIREENIESLRSVRIESEEVLLNYLEYRMDYNETVIFLISSQCNNNSFFSKDSRFFNQTKEVIESLNNNKSFIIYINISDRAWKVYNKQESVCLSQAQLSRLSFNTSCGKGEIIYGSWNKEAPLMC